MEEARIGGTGQEENSRADESGQDDEEIVDGVEEEEENQGKDMNGPGRGQKRRTKGTETPEQGTGDGWSESLAATALLAGVLGCVCVCARAPLGPLPVLAGACDVGVCARARVSAAPRHSRLWCWGVCVFVCALRLYPDTLGWGVWCVQLGLGFGLHPAILDSGFGACLVVCALCLHPAVPGSGGQCGCVCLGSGFGCSRPLLAGVCGVDVCAWARVSAARRQSPLGCWVVYVFACALQLYPVFPGSGVTCGCVCLGSGCGCAPPLLAGVSRCVCVCVRASLVLRHSWLGCAAWFCVLGLGFRLRPATPCWCVWVCVCLCAHSPCTPPLLDGMCVVGVRA